MNNVDLIITNATILSLDETNTIAGSLAVTDGQISGIWAEHEPPKEALSVTADTEVMNLKGATLLPGFIETHNHILMYAQYRKQLFCGFPANKNIDHLLKHLSEETKKTEPENWILGWGYDDTMLEEQRHPTRVDLDKVASDHPVFINHISGHIAVVNSKALEVTGLNETVENPSGGYFGRDENGTLNGVLHGYTAIQYIQSKLPTPTEDEMVRDLGAAADDYLAQGITTNTDASVGIEQGMKEVNVFLKASETNANKMHNRLMILHELLRKDEALGQYDANQLDEAFKKRSNGMARLDSAKLLQDGSLQLRSAALREPYYGTTDEMGAFIHSQEDINEETLDLHKRGFRIAIHGNGDRGIGSCMEAIENALQQEPRNDHRHRIEHAQTATVDDLDKMQKLGIASSFFINHVYYWGDRHKNIFLGPERASRINPLKDALERELLFTLHSDCPITPISPLFSVWAAVNRFTSSGEVLGKDQRIDVLTALKAMTIQGAKLNFEEDISGSVETGKRADFAILASDPTQVPSAEIKDIPILATIVNGEVVYKK